MPGPNATWGAAEVPRSELEEFWTELHNIMNHLAGTDNPDEFVSIMEATQEGLAEQEEFAGVLRAPRLVLENEKLTKEIEELTQQLGACCGLGEDECCAWMEENGKLKKEIEELKEQVAEQKRAKEFTRP